MKTRILLCTGLLAMGAIITLDSNRVIARGLTQSEHRSVPKNESVSGKNADYYKRSGNTKLDLGDYSAAIADYTRAIELKPNFDKAYFNRALAKHNLGDYSAAIADYNKSLEILPNDPLAYSSRGLAKHNLGDHSAAITDFNRAIELKPNYSEAYNNRGIAKGRLRQLSGAMADFNQALKFDPNNSAALKNVNELRQALEQNTLDHINRVRNAQTCCR